MDCAEQIMAREERLESIIRSGSFYVEVAIQRLSKAGHNRSAAGAVNFYRGVVTFGKKTKIHRISENINWRFFWWRFDLGGFAEMCFLDPYHFDKLDYELKYFGEETLLGRFCWIFQVRFIDNSKGWHFGGTIWVLQEDLTIIRSKGAFHPLHRIHGPIPVDDYWFSFDSWRKEVSPGIWMPDFTCTSVDVTKRDPFEPAFRARIQYFDRVREAPGAISDNSCGMESGHSPRKELEPDNNSGANPR
jgi:hypothetical protein